MVTPDKTIWSEARTGCVVAETHPETLLRFHGPEAVSFLQGQTSNDIVGLEPNGAGCPLVFPSVKGKVLLAGWGFRFGEEVLIRSDALRGAALLEHLKMYLMLSRTEAAIMEYGSITLLGPAAPTTCTELLGPAPAPPAPTTAGVFTLPGHADAFLLHVPLGRLPALQLWLPLSAGEDLRDALGHLPILPSALAEGIRIEEGVPRDGTDIDERHLPQEAGLDDALDFGKGCYTGQETIARLQYRGKTQRSLVTMVMSPGDPLPPMGTAVLAESEEVGLTMSTALSPALDAPVMFAYVRRRALEEERTLTVQGRVTKVRTPPLVPATLLPNS